MICSHHSILICGKHRSIKAFVNWLVIVGSCVSIMTRFVSASRLQLLRLMHSVQRSVNRVEAAKPVCETVV